MYHTMTNRNAKHWMSSKMNCQKKNCHGIRNPVDNIFCTDCRYEWIKVCDELFTCNTPTILVTKSLEEFKKC